MVPEGVRAALIAAGEELAAPVRDEVLALGPGATAPLLEVLQDEDLGWEDSPGEGRAPLHAIRLLGELRSAEAVEPLLDLLDWAGFDELLHSAAVLALHAIGAPALEPTLSRLGVLPILEEAELRDTYIGVLSGLGVRDDRIFPLLLELFGREPAWGAGELAEYGDPRGLAVVQAALDRHEVRLDGVGIDLELQELVFAIEKLGGTLTSAQRAKQAGYERLRAEWKAEPHEEPDGEDGFEDEAEDLITGLGELQLAPPSPRPAVRVERPGRNDKCWCGSGKKYKKCHLDADEAAARGAKER